MKQTLVTWEMMMSQVQEILRQLQHSQWTPDYVVGLTRGGLVPANLVSQYLAVPMETLKVSLRDGEDCESNFWMPEDAVNGKKILIVDDINDSGATLNWIQQDWQNSDPGWDTIWGNNVRVAVLYDNEASDNKIDISYTAETINKLEDPQWIVFPWEDWWKR
jgi:hypoxanthine phosphoribosyltransferase